MDIRREQTEAEQILEEVLDVRDEDCTQHAEQHACSRPAIPEDRARHHEDANDATRVMKPVRMAISRALFFTSISTPVMMLRASNHHDDEKDETHHVRSTTSAVTNVLLR